MQTYISTTIQKQRNYFASGSTLSLSFRKQNLHLLMKAMKAYEKRLTEALWIDLHKSYEEAYLTELSIVYGELRNHLRHLSCWAKPECRTSPIAIMPASSHIIKEPLGNTLIIAPWNYPVQLLLNPLVGAISAGCTAMLKPSPYTPHVSQVLTDMIRSTFNDHYIAIVEGNRQVNQLLLAERWDLIFFTGSPTLGKMVMESAAKNLTPVVLELGGKSPCIIDHDADIKVAAKRVAWGKVLNAGQTCIAPDYLMIHEDIKDKFLRQLTKEWKHLLTKNPQEAKHFVRIVNDKAMERLIGYLQDGTIYYGGTYDQEERFLHPTILTDVDPASPVMQEEIFGPIFPVLTFKEIDEVIAFINQREKPLALYYFGNNDQYVLRHTSSGGACVNDVIMHIVNHKLPFGGVGNSGMSSYHGKESFLVFSHRRSVVKTPTWIDMPFRYMPYRLFDWIKKMV
ncbi:MAG: aldehyde dehydrogenase [Paludibacteraceae bacterium]|nr:aldehyde dehydrogenase [Paludibacteraceae bacterium]